MALRSSAKLSFRVFLAVALASWLSQAHSATSTWNGGGGDNNFRTPANWLGGSAPAPGDILAFDGGVRLTPNNNYVAGTQFGGITFTPTVAGPFTLNGSLINLNGNITDSTQSFTNTINVPLALQTTPTINITSFGSLALNGVISGAFGLNETGGGVLILSGANTFTGNVLVGTGTTLSIANNNSLGAGTGASALSLAGGSTLKTTANLTLDTSRGIALGPGVATLDITTGTTLTYNGVISDNGGSGGFSKLSFGNVALGGANTYTGPTNIENGVLTLDFTQATAPVGNLINSSSALTLGGTNAGLGSISFAQLTLQGKASTTNNQSFSGTTINVGPAVIRANSGTGGAANLNLGAITVNKGGIASFVAPASGSISTTTTNTNGILGGWATIGSGATQNSITQGPDFAAVDGSGHIVAYTGYSSWASGNIPGNFASTANLQNTTAANLVVAPDNTGTVDINSLELNNVVNNQAISVGVGNTLRFAQRGAFS